MIVTIQPSQLSGTIVAPASKSSMQRACAAALVNTGTFQIVNPGKSNDDLAAIEVIKKLGAEVTQNSNDSLTIKSSGINPAEAEINCGESGLGIRMFTPIAALSNKAITVNGTGSLLSRPMHFFDQIFPQLHIQIQSQEGKLPLHIHGPLMPADITVDGSLSSQFLTGLLMAYAASATKPVTITVSNLKSKPYIDLTLQVMKDFEMNVPQHDNYKNFTFSSKNDTFSQVKNITYQVEGDWSGGAFLLVAGAIAGKIEVTGLDTNSTQADRAILQALIDCGSSLSIQDKVIEIGPAALKPFHFNATDCPDLFPPLVALAAYCNGTTTIEGVNRLEHKESNRALTLQDEFAKLGVEITLQDDLMLIKGGGEINGGAVHSRHDHRIAMACAVAGLRADAPVTIEDAEAINKSYPDFYNHLQQLGASVEL
jgi:3-phosphoshikimate 1-carboxyvinyltransferase